MALPILALLAACGTPQEQCIARNNKNYLVLMDLLEEVEGNLARGYAWEERQVSTPQWDICQDVLHDRDGNRRVVSHSCFRTVTNTERFRVPIDPVAETRKRDGLRQRLQALSPRAYQVTQACRTAYPEG